MSPFATYLLGFSIVLAGLALAAHMIGVTAPWIVIGAISTACVAVILAKRRAKRRGQLGG